MKKKKIKNKAPAKRTAKKAIKKSIRKAPPRKEITIPANKKLVLHVGCGDLEIGSGLHQRFKGNEWHEVRLDIDPTVKPDIIADMTNMHIVKENSFDAIWSSHNLEHVYAHQVMLTLKEFYRVLKVNGYLFMATPDIQRVAESIVKNGLERPLYKSPSGPIRALDILYGFSPSIAGGHVHMAHKTAFTAGTLGNKMKDAGFRDITVQRDGYNLWGIGHKRLKSTDKNSKLRILGDDINKMMRQRDELDVPPQEWKGLLFSE